MNIILFVAIFMAIVHMSVLAMLNRFRNKLIEGDVVGVVFGDYVVNRTVVRMTKDTVLVKNNNCSHLIEISKSEIFMPSKTSTIDKPVSEESID
jgi:hypothetical protein